MKTLENLRKSAIIAVFAGLVSCAGGERPEPIIQVREVQVPVSVPCQAMQRLGTAPAYPDTDQALRSSPSLFEQVQLLLAGRVLRIARLDATEAAIATCSR